MPLIEDFTIFLKYQCTLLLSPPYNTGCTNHVMFMGTVGSDVMLAVFALSFDPSVGPHWNIAESGCTRRRLLGLWRTGKVCLSLLGTWSGERGESWNSTVSSMLQVCPPSLSSAGLAARMSSHLISCADQCVGCCLLLGRHVVVPGSVERSCALTSAHWREGEESP